MAEPKRYIERGPNGKRPASKPPMYQKEVAVRKPSETTSPKGKGVSSPTKSTGIRPKVYSGELGGGEVANRGRSAGRLGRDAIEGERVVSNRGSNSASSTGGKGVSSSPTSSSRAVSPKVYEGELSGSTPRSTSGKASGNVYEGERISNPISTTRGASESASKPKANKIPGVKAASSEVLGSGSALRGAGRLLGRAAGPAALMLEPSELGDDETPYQGGKTSYSPTSARDRADELVGQPKPSSNSKPAEAVVAVKKSDSKSMAAPVKKPSPRETSGSRASRQAAYDAFKADQVDYNKGLANDRMGVSADETAAEDMITEGKLDGMKKGGMTKRPPARPAKKVPARKFASGGTTRSSTSHRGDGCATKGHTKGRVR